MNSVFLKDSHFPIEPIVSIPLNEFNRDNIMVESEIKVENSKVDRSSLGWFRRPFKYTYLNNSDELIIKGCEMLSKHGVMKFYTGDNNLITPSLERGFILGVINSDCNLGSSPEQDLFVSVINDIVNISQTFYTNVKSPIIVRPKLNTHNILFPIIAKEGGWPNFYDNNRNLLSLKQLQKTSIRFIPTFRVCDIYGSKYHKKIRLELIEATVIELIPRNHTDIHANNTSLSIPSCNISQPWGQNSLVSNVDIDDNINIDMETLATAATRPCTLF